VICGGLRITLCWFAVICGWFAVICGDLRWFAVFMLTDAEILFYFWASSSVNYLQTFGDVVWYPAEWLRHYRICRWCMTNGRAAIRTCVLISRPAVLVASVLGMEVVIHTWWGKTRGRLIQGAVCVPHLGAVLQNSEADTDVRTASPMRKSWWCVWLVSVVSVHCFKSFNSFNVDWYIFTSSCMDCLAHFECSYVLSQ